MRQRLQRAALVCAGIVVALAGCGGGDSASGPTPPTPTAATVTLTSTAATIAVGATVPLSATVRDAQGTTIAGKTLTWTSANGAVASVSALGLVTGVAAGRTTVRAAVDGKADSATIEVVSLTPALPAATCRNCLEVAPGGLLLPTTGATAQLTAWLVDAAGARTATNATFTSSNPGTVSVTPSGLVTAVAFGSARITAQANGQTAEPVLVLVTTPPAGAVLVADTVVIGRPVPSNPAAKYDVGYRYRVRLRQAVPVVGQMLIGTGTLPILGRVVSVTAVLPGVVDAELEIRPLAESFPTLSVNERWTLADGAIPTPAAGPGRGFLTAMRAEEPLEPNQFRLGPFVCEAGGTTSLSFPVNLVVNAIELNQRYDAELVIENGAFRKLVVYGSLSPRLALTPKLTAALEAEFECRKTLFKPRVPIRGPLAVLISPVIPIGVGFKFETKAEVANLGFEAAVQGQIGLYGGIACSGGACAGFSGRGGAGLTGSFKPTIPSLGDLRHEVAVGLFAFFELELTNPVAEALEDLFGERFEFTFFEATAGLKQSMKVASPTTQAGDPGYAADASLSGYWETATEAELKFGRLLSIQLLDLKEEGDSAISTTPKGTVLAAFDQIRAGTASRPGEENLLRATIFPVTYLGSPSVEEVQILRRIGNGPLTDPCGPILPDHAGQVEFECFLRFTEADVGMNHFYTFVRPKLFGAALSTPFEIAPDSKITVEVLEPCAAGSGPAPSRGGSDDTCVEEPPLNDLTLSGEGATIGIVDVPYLRTLRANGGTGVYSWSVVSGSLPGGLSFGGGGATATISGTPTGSPANGSIVVQVQSGSATAQALVQVGVQLDKWLGGYEQTIQTPDGPLVLYALITQYSNGRYIMANNWQGTGNCQTLAVDQNAPTIQAGCGRGTGSIPGSGMLTLTWGFTTVNGVAKRTATGTCFQCAPLPTYQGTKVTYTLNLVER